MNRHDKYKDSIRIKNIAFQDFNFSGNPNAIIETKFFNLPSEISQYNTIVSTFEADGGVAINLDVLSLAFLSDWKINEKNDRQIILLFADTDDSESKLEDENCIVYNPNIPKNYYEFADMWKSINKNATLVLLIARQKGSTPLWDKIEQEWDNVILIYTGTSGFSPADYQRALDEIAKAI